MKRTTLVCPILAIVVLVLVMPRLSQSVFGQTASNDTPHIGEGGLPQFQLDSTFPKVPSKWKMGFGSAVSVDDQDHIWVLSRPRSSPAYAKPGSTTPDQTSTPAPPVMEFDNDGNFIQGWGGESGPGYQWPSSEHGLTVDSKGFVWIVGSADFNGNNPANLPNDNQILKFTKTGKFVMAIGKSGQIGSNKTEVLKGAASLKYYAKTNELFVSDGYGNNRVMVYDADTGKFKRMWGAYGNKPLDPEDRPPRSKLTPEPWVAVSEVIQQFGNPVHDVAISNDDLLYVADRGSKRIQVFTPQGKFIAEQFLGLDNIYVDQARSPAFSPDQRFLYVSGTPVLYILNRRTLEVLGSIKVSKGSEAHPAGHLIAVDRSGNLYLAGSGGADGSGGMGPYKWVFKGYSPRVSCPPCESVKRTE